MRRDRLSAFRVGVSLEASVFAVTITATGGLATTRRRRTRPCVPLSDAGDTRPQIRRARYATSARRGMIKPHGPGWTSQDNPCPPGP